VINPTLGRQIAASVDLATADHTFDPSQTLARFPIPLTRMADVVRNVSLPGSVLYAARVPA